MALISTKSPTLLRPARMPVTHIAITAARPAEKMIACPALSTASDT
jgi:hypothetical protein